MIKIGRKMILIILIAVNIRFVLADVSSNAGKLIITEVAPKASSDWVELYVVDGSVDWTGYRLHKGASTYAFTIPSDWISNGLTTGDYIVIHAEAGTDDVSKNDNNSGYWDGYGMGILTGTDYIIQVKEPSGSTKRVDAVIWSNNNASFTSSVVQANEAVSDGMWNSYDFSTGDAGAWTNSDGLGASSSLARYLTQTGSEYVDINSKNDWYKSSSPTAGSINDVSLPVSISYFFAAVSDESIIIVWTTESEVETQGFHILRSDNREGPYEQISTFLIPGQGNSATRRDYEFIDKDIVKGKKYYYRLKEVSTSGNTQIYGPACAVLKTEIQAPDECRLFCNHPNPFNPYTKIRYHISDEFALHRISLRIYNILGQEVALLIDRIHEPGEYSVIWNGFDFSGIEAASGIYFCQMLSDNQVLITKRMLKMK